MILPFETARAEAEYGNERCVVSVTVDVSGSMKRTDAKRDVPETIKLMMDICDENDYFSVVAYNDEIVYSSGLISMSDTNAVSKLKQDLDELVYEGNTDNGLGLLRAVTEVTGFEEPYDRALVILVSDGNTDLSSSKTGRTAEDSVKDIEQSTEWAKEKDIPLFVIEYTDNYTSDTSLLSVAASSSGGGISMVDSPESFVQVMINSFCTGYQGGKTFYSMETADEKLNRIKLESVSAEGERELFLVYSWESIADIEVLDKDFDIKPSPYDRYLLLEAGDQAPKSVELIYGLEGKGTVLFGTIKAEKPVKPVDKETIIQEPEPSAVPASAIPVGSDYECEEYSSKEKLRIDVSTLFQDDDVVSYKLDGADERVDLTGGILNVDVSKEGEIAVKVVAIDAVGNSAEANVRVTVMASWRKHQSLLTAGVILLIVLMTTAICYLIIKKTVFHREKRTKVLSGKMIARFVDIKSKNDIPDIMWDLQEYPKDGISLKELFYSKDVKEELKDIDKICFYPGETENTVQLIHCMEGGVFVGDHHVTANMPTIIKRGDKIYVSIAENASEIELTYTGS